MSASELAKFGYVSSAFKVGQRVNATYLGGGNFSLIEKTKLSLTKGSLVIARFVKHVLGKGVTVQISHNKEQHQFGFIPICEITDEINANVVKYIADKSVFAARIIDFDQKVGKPILSARESIVDEKSWKNICPEGTSIAFKEAD